MSGSGFIVNTRGKFLICTSCRRAILGSIAASHAHGHKLKSFRKNSIETYIRHQHLLNTEADLDTFLQVKCHLEFKGLETIDGYMCGHCHYICGKEQAMRQHLSDTHQHLPSRRRYSIVKVQHAYFHPNPNVFIRVREQLETPQATDLRTLWDQSQPDFTSIIPSTVLPTRQLPPWLNTLKWNDHLRGTNPNTVTEVLAAMAKTSEYQLLYKSITFYLENAMRRLNNMLPQIRQVLKSVTTYVSYFAIFFLSFFDLH